jgi:hypothetical protein
MLLVAAGGCFLVGRWPCARWRSSLCGQVWAVCECVPRSFNGEATRRAWARVFQLAQWDFSSLVATGFGCLVAGGQQGMSLLFAAYDVAGGACEDRFRAGRRPGGSWAAQAVCWFLCPFVVPGRSGWGGSHGGDGAGFVEVSGHGGGVMARLLCVMWLWGL